jgi:hypothetical protein
MQKNRNWLMGLKKVPNNWEMSYVYKTLSKADENDEIFELLSNFLNSSDVSFHAFFNSPYNANSNANELFLIKLKNAWLAKKRRLPYSGTAALSCILKAQSKILLKRMAIEEQKSMAALLDEMILKRAKRVKYIDNIDLGILPIKLLSEVNSV